MRTFASLSKGSIFDKFIGEVAEWSIAAVLKTVEGNTSRGSNPCLSAINLGNQGLTENVHEFVHELPRI